MHLGSRQRPPLSPQEAWLSDGRQVLHFRPTRWDRWCQQLEVTVGELLPDQPVPLLKRRLELSREEALKLWSEKRKEGWQPTQPAAGALGRSSHFEGDARLLITTVNRQSGWEGK
ncbi:DUF1651 domain-containing protein [Synechococcus sp. CBW1108]|uniref:DUF1651 domain-containing protein n=1 Tax=Synechococcus sp. CBW1108 TaxID=1353147 RepID=UPI0018CED96C|nr:DUF1651 domain-containing protein [Synechococcus sp. CBW1108]QPN70031.1 DUF1651 domain-containing protein [Synechococcus sp. CBW1108]